LHVAVLLAVLLCAPRVATADVEADSAPVRLETRDGYVDTGGAIIYYVTIGAGRPLMVLHGGPGSTHDYFLPWLLPLANGRQLVFIDERGSGRSQLLADRADYTLDSMARDVEAMRGALGLGEMDLMGHSFGGLLAQAVAVSYPATIRRLILAGTGSSAARVNADFRKIKDALDPELRARIDALEARGITGTDGAQLPEYRKLADQALGPYSYFARLPPWDSAGQPMGWDVLNEVWGDKSDFHIDGNLAGFDFTEDLRQLEIPALILYGDHDIVSDATARETHSAMRNSTLVKMPKSAHMMFVDQNEAFIETVSRFLDRE
jgi:proline iminopeptidase